MTNSRGIALLSIIFVFAGQVQGQVIAVTASTTSITIKFSHIELVGVAPVALQNIIAPHFCGRPQVYCEIRLTGVGVTTIDGGNIARAYKIPPSEPYDPGVLCVYAKHKWWCNVKAKGDKYGLNP